MYEMLLWWIQPIRGGLRMTGGSSNQVKAKGIFTINRKISSWEVTNFMAGVQET
jgi:hypothetical protein